VSDMRIGMGYDVHAFAEGLPLVLGGVDIPSGRGLKGHSDADVLAHALMDAILGAMRAGDIGAHFPDNDPNWQDMSSMLLLQHVAEMMQEGGFRLVDADCVLALEEPRVSAFRDAMRAKMAKALGVGAEAIGVKATTTEGLGLVGRGEGAAAWAVVLLETSAG
jgi:2-C-methyl-D-erythritol 2,4-cyclodiphosphate synthase